MTLARRLFVAAASLALLAFPATASANRMSAVKHVEVDGMSVGYREGGRGPDLVMVGGRSATMADWDPRLLGALSLGHHVVVFDNRGVATTDNPSQETLTVEQMAQDTLGLMTALGIEQADLLGWSLGGTIVQQATLDAPSRVHRLVLCSTSPGGSHSKQAGRKALKALESPSLGSLQLFELSFPRDRAGRQGKARYLARIAKQQDLVPDSFTLSEEAQEQQAAAAAQWRAPSGGDYDELSEIKQRTLVAFGKRDRVDPPANDRLLARRIPHARAMPFANAGHAFLFQFPTRVGVAIRRFLEE